jgi:hypothetical protein
MKDINISNFAACAAVISVDLTGFLQCRSRGRWVSNDVESRVAF